MAEEFMANSVRTHGIENGKKIEEHTLIATGGGGPLHSIGIAKKLASFNMLTALTCCCLRISNSNHYRLKT